MCSWWGVGYTQAMACRRSKRQLTEVSPLIPQCLSRDGIQVARLAWWLLNHIPSPWSEFFSLSLTFAPIMTVREFLKSGLQQACFWMTDEPDESIWPLGAMLCSPVPRDHKWASEALEGEWESMRKCQLQEHKRPSGQADTTVWDLSISDKPNAILCHHTRECRSIAHDEQEPAKCSLFFFLDVFIKIT